MAELIFKETLGPRDAASTDHRKLYVTPAGEFRVVDEFGVDTPLVEGLPPTTGDQFSALIENPGNVPIFSRVTEEMIVPALSTTVSPSLGNFFEIGKDITNPQFMASYLRGPANVTGDLTVATFIDNQGNPIQDLLLVNPNLFTHPVGVVTYNKTTNNDSVIFTLAAQDVTGNTGSATTIFWRPFVYFGASTQPGLFDETFIKSLSNELGSSRTSASPMNITAGAGEYLYYAFPEVYGTPTFFIGGFEEQFTEISTTIAVTSTADVPVVQNYRLYESINTGLGTTLLVVT